MPLSEDSIVGKSAVPFVFGFSPSPIAGCSSELPHLAADRPEIFAPPPLFHWWETLPRTAWSVIRRGVAQVHRRPKLLAAFPCDDVARSRRDDMVRSR